MGNQAGTLPSLRYFLLGIAPWVLTAIVTRLRLFDSFNPVACVLTGMMIMVTPYAFALGARRAWAERQDGRRRATISRLLNIVGLTFYFGLVLLFVLMNVILGP